VHVLRRTYGVDPAVKRDRFELITDDSNDFAAEVRRYRHAQAGTPAQRIHTVNLGAKIAVSGWLFLPQDRVAFAGRHGRINN
jgi:hypothetical protein